MFADGAGLEEIVRGSVFRRDDVLLAFLPLSFLHLTYEVRVVVVAANRLAVCLFSDVSGNSGLF
jgi:hypothetical protein